MIVIADCNNFYASCERLFRPDLEGKPIVVLSNNDGCVIARSNEVKALGVKMGVPFFKIKSLVRQHNISVFSSNFSLYGDLSDRVMCELDAWVPDISVYSIDEAFLDFDNFAYEPLNTYLSKLKKAVKTNVGVPVSLGGAPTKTLAKLANNYAKKHPETDGVMLLENDVISRDILAQTSVGDVWGVGRRTTKQLNERGVKTALDLADSDIKTIRSRFSVVMERTVNELNGIRCIDFHEPSEARQQIVVSRSFGQRVTEHNELKGLICGYISRAAEKLRQDGSVARKVSVFLRTSPFGDHDKYSNGMTLTLGIYTADTAQLIKAANRNLDVIYRPGYLYAKAGVMLSDITPAENIQLTLFGTSYDNQKVATMEVMDKINAKFGDRALHFGSERPQRWNMRQNHLSPRYTTSWADIKRVR